MVPLAVQRLGERLLAALPATRAYTLTALGRAGLPGPIVHFIAQTLQRRLEAEAQALSDARTRWFDYADADLQAAQEQYFEVLAEHAQVPPEEWERTLRQAVEQVVPFLVQPARALGAFVFPEGRDTLPAAVVLRRMRYFDAYPYLNEVVVAYVQRKGMEDVERATFVPLLHRIEHRTPEEYTPEGWRALLAPLFETVGEGTPPAVPADLLARFFADKGMRAAGVALLNRGGSLTADEMVEVLATPASPPAPAPAAEAPTPAAPALRPAEAARPTEDAPAPPAFSGEAPAPAVPPIAPAAPAPIVPAPAPAAPAPVPSAPAPQVGAVPLWQRYRQEGTPRPQPVSTPMPAPVAQPAPAPPPTSPVQRARHTPGAAPLWQRFRKGDDAAEPGTEPDSLDRLESAVLGGVGRGQRRVFVRQLFSGSEDAYRALLERLRPARSWAEASHLIAESFRQHQVNIYQEAAVLFTDRAEARFS